MKFEMSAAWLELGVAGKLDEDEAPLPAIFDALGVEVRPFHEKDMVRGRIKVARSDLVVGGVASIAAALRQSGRRLPVPIGYPAEIRPFLRRSVWESTLGEVRRGLEEGGEALFVKPSASLKRFSGLVVTDTGDLGRIASVSGSCPVWCSQVVEWLSEFRVFLLRGKVVGICWYAGQRHVEPDPAVVEGCRRRLSTATGAFDIGVLRDGRTALVEINDGFAIGRYDLDPHLYLDVLTTRWNDLTDAPAS